jgi:hypothetical protein
MENVTITDSVWDQCREDGKVHLFIFLEFIGVVAQAQAPQQIKVQCSVYCMTNASVYFFRYCLAQALRWWRVHVAVCDWVITTP